MAQRIGFWFVLVVALLFGYFVSVKQEWITGSIAQERASSYALLGKDTARMVEVRALNMFTTLFTNTGAVDVSKRLLTTGDAPSDSTSADPFVDSSNQVLDWMAERVKTVWLVAYQFLFRISVAMVWWPLSLLCVVPFLADAVARRAVMASSFDHNSPHLFSMALRGMLAAVVLVPILLLLPYSMPPYGIPLLILVASIAFWIVVVNFTKRA